MKLFITLYIMLLHSIGFSQYDNTLEPFILRGQIRNSLKPYFMVQYKNKYYINIIDTVKLDDKGRYYHQMEQLKYPQRVNVKTDNIVISDLFIAPGFNLEINGDAKDKISFIETKTISGKGENTNSFRRLLDSLVIAKNNNQNIYTLDNKSFLKYLTNTIKQSDSLAKAVFGRPNLGEIYSTYFKDLVIFENGILKLYHLTSFVERNNFSASKAINFLKSNINEKIFKSLFKEQYLISNIYQL